LSITGAYYDGTINYYIDPAGNPCATPSSAVIHASITDPSGVNQLTVYLHWTDPNGGGHSVQMGYNLSTHLYAATITSDPSWNPGTIQYWIEASDNFGNHTKTASPPDSSHWLFEGNCIV
jgi:hypothetical protein